MDNVYEVIEQLREEIASTRKQITEATQIRESAIEHLKDLLDELDESE